MRHILEEFEVSSRQFGATPAGAEVAQADAEEIRSRGYEAGYASGWEDAAEASRVQGKRVTSEFERCVQDLGFTYHEAVGQLRGEIAKLLDALLDQFFAEIAPDMLKLSVREEILKLAEAHLNPSIELIASTNTAPLFEDLVDELSQFDLVVRPEPSLGENQAYLRLGKEENVTDFNPLVDMVRAQLAAFQDLEKPKASSG